MGGSGVDYRRDGAGELALGSVPGLSIQWVSSADHIPFWLWDACLPPPLEGRFWYAALERAGLEEQFRFFYALIHCGDRPAGIAPAFVMDVPMDLVAPPLLAALLKMASRLVPGAGYQRTLFIGSPCADEGSVGLAPPLSLPEVAPVLQAAAERLARQLGAAMVVWKDFPAGAACGLVPFAASSGMFLMDSYPGTSLALPPGGLPDYLETLKGSRRHNLRKKLRRSKERGPLVVEVMQRPDAAALEQIFQLFWQTYEKGKTKFERLTAEFFRIVSASDDCHFVTLRLPDSGRMVAFMMCFKLGRRVINKFIGLDYRLDGDWFLYFRLWEAAVAWAMASGACELQSGQTGYRAKLDVGHKLVPLVNLCKHLNPLLNRIYSRLSRDVSWSTLDSDLAQYLIAHPDEDRSCRGAASRLAAPP